MATLLFLATVAACEPQTPSTEPCDAETSGFLEEPPPLGIPVAGLSCRDAYYCERLCMRENYWNNVADGDPGLLDSPALTSCMATCAPETGQDAVRLEFFHSAVEGDCAPWDYSDDTDPELISCLWTVWHPALGITTAGESLDACLRYAGD